MARYIEFHGRLARSDARGVSPAEADLHVSLHPDATGGPALWEEVHAGVPIGADGAFHVVLGRATAVHPELFRDGPVWLAVRRVQGGAAGEESSPRTPISGALILLSAAVDALDDRLDRLESGAGGASPDTARRLRVLHRRLKSLEAGKGPLAALAGGLDDVRTRVAQLDGEGGRLDRIEDEVEDIVGPDGDIIDLLERMEKLEGTSPVPKRAPPPPGPLARLDPRFIAQLAEKVEALTAEVAALAEKASAKPDVTADSIHAVKRGGDVMTGGLTINRGGLEVLSGGITCRGADVNSLEASVQVKAPKVIADAIELRGDLTVDNTRRALQVRNVEGRAGSGRKDGALHLNTRSGDEVVVGNAEVAAGLAVHGPVAADSLAPRASGLATRLDARGGLEAGELCAVDRDGRVVRAHAQDAPAIVGVCVATAAVLDGAGGEGRASVAYGGVVQCRVAGPVTAGDLLVASATAGRACAAAEDIPTGARVGRALASSKGATGEIPVLLLLG